MFIWQGDFNIGVQQQLWKFFSEREATPAAARLESASISLRSTAAGIWLVSTKAFDSVARLLYRQTGGRGGDEVSVKDHRRGICIAIMLGHSTGIFPCS
jgi:hypothetical protein